VGSFTLVKDDNASKNYTAGQNILDVVKFTVNAGVAGFEAIGNAKIVEFFKLKDGRIDMLGQDDIPPSNTLKTDQFTPADVRDQTEIEFTHSYYFVVKTTGSGDWSTWYLMSGKNEVPSCFTASNPKCVAVTVWKVQ